jgi:hypothetical protein
MTTKTLHVLVHGYLQGSVNIPRNGKHEINDKKNYQKTDILIGLQNCNIDLEKLEPALRYHLLCRLN